MMLKVMAEYSLNSSKAGSRELLGPLTDQRSLAPKDNKAVPGAQ